MARLKGCVELSPRTAEALDVLGIVGDVGQVNVGLEKMAWLVLVLKHIPDSEGAFPHGKSSTIQHLERQLDEEARLRAAEIVTEQRRAPDAR